MLWLIPVFQALHNAEEALTFPEAVPGLPERLPGALRPIVAEITVERLRAALLIATVVPLGLVVWARLRPRSAAALWAALLTQAVVALNVVWHLAAALFVARGYSPGLLTALGVNLPFSIYLFARARREAWLSERALAALLPAALIVHGPVLAGAILLAGSMAAA